MLPVKSRASGVVAEQSGLLCGGDMSAHAPVGRGERARPQGSAVTWLECAKVFAIVTWPRRRFQVFSFRNVRSKFADPSRPSRVTIKPSLQVSCLFHRCCSLSISSSLCSSLLTPSSAVSTALFNLFISYFTDIFLSFERFQ